MTKLTLNVEGMHCKSCVMLVQDSLEGLGAKDIKIDLDEKAQKAVVSCDYGGDKMDIITKIKEEGYRLLKP